MVVAITMNKDGFMVFPYNFISPLQVEVEEVQSGVAIIKGTLLVEGVTKNNHLYTIDEMENIAKQAIGVPITYGIKVIYDSNGRPIKQLHDDSEPAEVGRIMDTFFDKENRKITFIGNVVNTEKHPDIVTKVRNGWGISIGGMVQEARYVLDAAKRLVMRIKDMLVQHVALIPPTIVRGQDEAKVEQVTINEVMEFDIPPVNLTIKVGKGVRFKGFSE
jgi:DNA polymerase II small subunit/DNA polymerase delta subunit B